MIFPMKIELLGNVSIYFGLGIQTLTALLLGGIIGWERELKNKSAGIKTNMLICIGACLYTAVSLLNQNDHGGLSDPNRIAAQVVSGIGFLGAGAIIQSRGNIIGMTTAASIWVVAAIGVTIGCGYPVVATIFTLTTIVVLRLVSPLYRLIERKKDVKPMPSRFFQKVLLRTLRKVFSTNMTWRLMSFGKTFLIKRKTKDSLLFLHIFTLERLIIWSLI